MSMFNPPKPPQKPSTPAAPSRLIPSRGDRVAFPKPASPPSPNRPRYPGGSSPRRDVIEEAPSAFLCGEKGKAYFDDRGFYVIVRAGGRKIVERYGPRKAMDLLTAEEREMVRLARRRYKAAQKKEADGV